MKNQNKSNLIFLLLTFNLLIQLLVINVKPITNNVASPNAVCDLIDKEIKIEESSEDFDPSTANIIVTKEEGYFDGYNLMIVERSRISNPSDRDGAAIITDMDGNIINNLSLPENWGMMNPINSTTILVAPFDGNVYFWNFYTGALESYHLGTYHHDVSYNPYTQTFLYLTYTIHNVGGYDYYCDVLVEKNLNGDVVWELDTYESFLDVSYWLGEYKSGKRDLSHSNTVFWDIEEDMIYVNMRNLNTFYKIDHSLSKMVWSVGQYGNFNLYNRFDEERTNLFYHAHAVEKIDSNTFIIFDNDYLNESHPLYHHSRILEIDVNETAEIAEVSWVYSSPYEYYSSHWGDADRLPNGNRLGTFGTITHPSTTLGARLVEVNPEGEIVWELDYQNGGDYQYGIYKMDRFLTAPLLTPQKNQYFTTDEDVEITWETWYNFRSKNTITGSYKIYLNDTLVDSNVHTFEKFWHSNNLTINLGTLTSGTYNLTLLLYDEDNHSSRNEIFITINDFYLERIGPTEIELGQPNTEIVWTGASVTLMDYNITRNETEMQSGKWDSGEIILDLSSFTLGVHRIQFLLYNQSVLSYNDTFFVIVYPQSSPVILSWPEDESIFWNDILLLTWEIFDNTPSYWELYINDVLNSTEEWNNKFETINWWLPTLDEGYYAIELVIFDSSGLSTKNITQISIFAPSPPVIISPSSSIVIWGENVTLVWEVHGGIIWTIYKNDTLYESGIMTSKYILLEINDWTSSKWLPGFYNIELFVIDEMGKNSTNEVTVEVIVVLGDIYANNYLPNYSMYYLNGENAIGAPNGQFSTITYDYDNGYLTLDMGKNEEIIDGEGNDFQIIASGGEYSVWISNDLNTPFIYLGSNFSDASFDISTSSLSIARYVRIEYRSGDDVLIDSIVAYNYNVPIADTKSPIIEGPEDLSLYRNQSLITLTWKVSDATPFNYSIKVNDFIVEANRWDGKNIDYNFTLSETGTFNITLRLFDLFSNSAEDTVIIEVLNETISIKPWLKYTLISIGSSVSVTLIGFSVYYIRKRKK